MGGVYVHEFLGGQEKLPTGMRDSSQRRTGRRMEDLVIRGGILCVPIEGEKVLGVKVAVC